MESLKSVIESIGMSVATTSFSVVKDFYGYMYFGHKFPLSLAKQMRLLKGKHIHINIIQVGLESLDEKAEKVMDASIEEARGIFSTIKLGIGRVERFYLSIPEVEDKMIIDSDEEAITLTNSWSAPNSGIDVFFVELFTHTFASGMSPTGGSCEKEGNVDATGVIIMRWGISSGSLSSKNLGHTIAHEIAHYLGADHVCKEDGSDCTFPDDMQYLMFPAGGLLGTKIHDEVAEKMKQHCFVNEGV